MKLPGFISRILRSKLVGSTAIMTIGNGTRLVLGAVTFLIVARDMGKAEFGIFAAVVAAAQIAMAFSGLGSDVLVIRRVARDVAEFSRALLTALGFLAVSGPVLLAVYIAVMHLIFGAVAPITLLLLVGVSDIVCQPLNNICAACFLARGRPIGTAWLNIVFTGIRVMGALIWISVTQEHTALSWAGFYVAGSALAAALSLAQVVMSLGRPGGSIRWSDWYDGFHYALQNSFASSFRQIDRPVIAYLSSPAVVGVYAAAFRIADAASMPVQAIMYATFNRFFQLGAKGTSHSLRFALRILPFAVGAGVLAGIAVAVVAPFAPLLLGPAYAGTKHALLLLSALPVLLAFSYVGGDILLGSDHVALRTLILFAMPVVSVAMCFVFVPQYGTLGAVYATLSTNAISAAVSWSAAFWVSRRQELRTAGE
jgi:O-antigen/teichoic acid export membrane protein